jgi:hypothetical protein
MNEGRKKVTWSSEREREKHIMTEMMDTVVRLLSRSEVTEIIIILLYFI